MGKPGVADSVLWQDLTKFAKKYGFEAKRDGNVYKEVILLPIDNIANTEYGVALTYDYVGHEINESATPYVLRNGKYIDYSKEHVDCYAHEYIIKTAEFKDKKYVIEKTEKNETFDRMKALIWAFKFKDIGTLDSSFLGAAYQHIFWLLQRNIAKELASNKMSELEEKLTEVEALASELPYSDGIIDNITKEFRAYSNAAIRAGIIPNAKFPKLAEKVYYKIYTFTKDWATLQMVLESFTKFTKWCKEAGNNVDHIAKEIIEKAVIELEEEIESAPMFLVPEGQATVRRASERFSMYRQAAQDIGIYSEIPAIQSIEKKLEAHEWLQLEQGG